MLETSTHDSITLLRQSRRSPSLRVSHALNKLWAFFGPSFDLGCHIEMWRPLDTSVNPWSGRPPDFFTLPRLIHINLTGDYHWETSLTLGPDQFRPLRTRSHDLAAA